MSDDLIKRSDAIAEIYKTRTPDVVSHHYAEMFINAVRRAPSADRPQGWIPCSEKLPEADGLYLATFTLIGIPKFSNVESFKNGKWEYHNGYIIAWMPLPEPWKGADDER